MQLWIGVISHATSEVPAPPSDVKYSARSIRPENGLFVSLQDVVPANRPTTNDIAMVVPAKIGDDCIIFEGARGLRLVALSEELYLAQCQTSQSVQGPIDADLQRLIREEVLSQVAALQPQGI